MTGSPAEKRKALRIQPFLAPCRVVQGSRRFAGHLIDLSLDGGRVACKVAPPPTDAAVVLEVRFGVGPARTRLPARVRWSRRRPEAEDGHVFGVTFAGVGSEGQRVLETALDEFRRRVATLA